MQRMHELYGEEMDASVGPDRLPSPRRSPVVIAVYVGNARLEVSPEVQGVDIDMDTLLELDVSDFHVDADANVQAAEAEIDVSVCEG